MDVEPTVIILYLQLYNILADTTLRGIFYNKKYLHNVYALSERDYYVIFYCSTDAFHRSRRVPTIRHTSVLFIVLFKCHGNGNGSVFNIAKK